MKENLAKALKEIRIQQGLSMRAHAKLLNIDHAAYRRYALAIDWPYYENLLKLVNGGVQLTISVKQIDNNANLYNGFNLKDSSVAHDLLPIGYKRMRTEGPKRTTKERA